MRLLIAFVFLIAASTEVQAVEISNFRSGLACTNSTLREGSSGWICHPTEDIRITDQGTCRYDGKDMPCTWLGFEFDYRKAKPGDHLDCNVSQSQPTDFGNPREHLKTDATSQDFTLPLEKSEGHFFNPQYFAFVTRPSGENYLLTTGRCSFAGKIVFEYTFRIQFPVLPETRPGA